jgi:uncharacterized glyoxalase superfamily protein PhnB
VSLIAHSEEGSAMRAGRGRFEGSDGTVREMSGCQAGIIRPRRIGWSRGRTPMPVVERGRGMTGRVTSVFLYVKDVRKSMEFYNEVVGADIIQIHAEHEHAPYSLAILRLGSFTLMLHPQEPHAQEFADTRVGVGMHLQLQVPDVDKFYDHCLEAGALLSVSGEPTDQSWGWREFALRDPDGYVWSIYQDKSGGQWTM